MKKMYIVGNWKMTPDSPKGAIERYKEIKTLSSKKKIKKAKLIICPPSIYLGFLDKVNGKKSGSMNSSNGISLGVQDVSLYEGGSHTGETSALMAKKSGAQYAIIGHSEKKYQGGLMHHKNESDDIIAEKIRRALDVGLTPIICVGEKERDEHGMYLGLLKKEIINVLSLVKGVELGKMFFAYEPVYAVGGKEALKADDIHQMILFVKKVLADRFGDNAIKQTKILYGGSIDVKSAKEIIDDGEVDGFLIGRASFDPKSFVTIASYV